MDSALRKLSHEFQTRARDVGVVLEFVVAWIPLALLLLLPGLGLLWRRRRGNSRLPPGPCRIPILGSLPFLGSLPPHQAFYQLSRQHGPLLYLQMGCRSTVVVSNAAMAALVLKNHDEAFASRPATATGRILGNNYSSIVFAPYGAHFKRLRKALTQELLSTKKVHSLQEKRERHAREMVRQLALQASWQPIDMASTLLSWGLSTMMSAAFGFSIYHPAADPAIAQEMVKYTSTLREVTEVAGSLNIGDLIPLLRWILPLGVESRMKALLPTMRKLPFLLIHRQRSDPSPEPNILQVLLSSPEESRLSDHDICELITDILIAGSDTTAVTVEWALAELLRHPQHLETAQAELDEVVGRERLVEECDIPHLPFLQCIVKETFRLHPPAPLAIPHFSQIQCTVSDFHIPADTTLFLNLWAIGRDPVAWANPLQFDPTRFRNSDISVFGHHPQLLPFGAGRRGCPGMFLGNLSVQIALASLLQSFHWTSAQDHISMEEKFGLVVSRKHNLFVSLSPRLQLSHLTSFEEN